ncbi:MAG: maleylpyruvate isomerase N-terminal domain-containing protein [Nocardioides sp.]
MSSPGTATRLDFVERYVAAAERFAVAVAGTDMDAVVPACPTWSVYDLVCHLGNVHAWAATIVETGARAVDQNDEPRSRKPKVVSEWYAGKAEDLYEVLRHADPEARCWNFAFDTGGAAFWQRRQLHETTIHTVDLFAAARRESELRIEPDVAADGIDEVLTVFLHRMHHRGRPATLTAPLCVVATDVDRAWTVTPRAVVTDPTAAVPAQKRGSVAETAPALIEGPPRVVERRHPAADQVAGTADVLYRVLWKRAPATELTVAGDLARIDAFLASPLVP